MQKTNTWLHRFSMLTVLAALSLILIGSLVTTNGAGMAFADWPLSAGSVNPDGWWSHFFQRLEHGHRLFAEFTGCLVGILCAWVWGNKWAFPAAIAGSGVLSAIAKVAGAPSPVIAHVGIWSSALIFAGILLLQSRQVEQACQPLVRWLAFAAFCGVVVQAVLGGFRVTLESGGNPHAAMIFRVIHGCFAQVEFGLLVVIASMLSSSSLNSAGQVSGASRVRNLAWVTFGFIFLQLVVGATMRHMGAGLAIPTFPKATADGAWMPSVHNAFVDTNFTHTRLLALLVTIHVILLARRVFASTGRVPALTRPALLVLLLLVAQVALGISVIWTYRRVFPTTLHVINGTVIFATSLLLAVRATRLSSGAAEDGEPESSQNLRRITA